MAGATVPFEALLAHEKFLRSLARVLVADPQLADDVVQQTWVSALERPPREGGSPRSWLSTVARNLARHFARAEARRRRHEQAAARPEALPSTAEVVEREAARRELVEAVLALEEPYRSTILVRYFEGLPPREAAKRFGKPVSTVRSRTQRAVALLRERLDERHGGDRKAWFLVLGRLAMSTSSSLLPGGLVAAAGLAAIGVSVAVVALRTSTPRVDPATTAREPRTTAAAPAAAASGAPARESLPPAAEPPVRQELAATPAPDPNRAVLKGRCLAEETGEPLPGCLATLRGWLASRDREAFHEPVVWKNPDPVESGADGRFEISFEPPPPYPFGLDLRAEGRVPRTGRWSAIRPGETVDLGDVQFASGWPVRGRVLDTEGKPVSGASIGLRSGFPWRRAPTRRASSGSRTADRAAYAPAPSARSRL